MDGLLELMNAVVSAITRGKVMFAQPGSQRTALQVGLLDNEDYDVVPLMLPFGMTALPTAGSDVLILSIAGQRDHKVALVADQPAQRIPDVGPGEFGFRDGNGQQVVFRADHLEVTSPLPVIINGAKEIQITGSMDISITSDTKVILTAPEVHVGGAGGRRVVLDGDPVSTGGTVTATSTNAWGL